MRVRTLPLTPPGFHVEGDVQAPRRAAPGNCPLFDVTSVFVRLICLHQSLVAAESCTGAALTEERRRQHLERAGAEVPEHMMHQVCLFHKRLCSRCYNWRSVEVRDLKAPLPPALTKAQPHSMLTSAGGRRQWCRKHRFLELERDPQTLSSSSVRCGSGCLEVRTSSEPVWLPERPGPALGLGYAHKGRFCRVEEEWRRSGGSRDVEPREEGSEEPSAQPLITAAPYFIFFFVENIHPWMLQVLFNKLLRAPRRRCGTSVHAGGMEGLEDGEKRGKQKDESGTVAESRKEGKALSRSLQGQESSPASVF